MDISLFLAKLSVMKPYPLLFSLAFIAQQSAAQEPAAVQQVLAAQEQRFRAMTTRDMVTLETLLADDLYYIHSNAMTEDKAQHLEAIASGKIVYEKITPVSTRVRRYGKTGIADGKAHVAVQLNGQRVELTLLFTAVYHREKGRWRLTSWQSTRVP